MFPTFDNGALHAENLFLWGYVFPYDLFKLSITSNFPHMYKAVGHSIKWCCDSCSKPQSLQGLSSNSPQILRS